MSSFKRAKPRKAKCFYVPDIEFALDYLRQLYREIEFNSNKTKLIVTLSGSLVLDSLVKNTILEELEGAEIPE